MQDELETMLRRWTELEPERCAVDPVEGPFVVCAGVWVPIRWIDHREYIVLGAVIEAIEARGWGWEIVYDQIQRLYQATLCDDWSKWIGSSEWDDTPAAALLTAYVQALEAQPA